MILVVLTLSYDMILVCSIYRQVVSRFEDFLQKRVTRGWRRNFISSLEAVTSVLTASLIVIDTYIHDCVVSSFV
jgi:hypothetical protein